MKKYLFFLICSLCCLYTFAAKPVNTYVRIQVKGKMCIVRLYNQTPQHRDNFIKLAQSGFYNDLLFHRVIQGFMIQGGDPESREAKYGQLLGEGDLDYKIPAELNDSLFHKKGVLAAARDDNPEKASSACQFYLVQGKVYTDKELDRMEELRLKRKIPAYQREVYKTLGGTPFLDHSYTVFGEAVKGIDLIDSLAARPTDENNRPVEDQRMTVEVLTPLATRQLEAELQGLPYKPNIFRRLLDLFSN